jgi:ketosteroid isomerase-like protein
MSECRCSEASLLWGPRADDYADAHLVREAVGESAEEVLYRCPDTGRLWVLDVAAAQQGGSALRLRWLLGTAELVEHLAAAQAVDRLAFTHPDIEFQPVGSTEVYRGLEEARRWVEKTARDPDSPRATAISLIDQGEQVVVFGSVSHRRDGGYTEHRPAAWLVSTKGGRIARSIGFESWTAAREAAGLPAAEAGGGPPPRKLSGSLLFAVRRGLAGYSRRAWSSTVAWR